MPAAGAPADARLARLLEGLDPSQRAAVTFPERPLAIIAGAGSGKTRVLTRRIAYECARGRADPAHVLALTFTRKAAGELRARLSRLGVREQVTAGTFHAVALAQLRRLHADRGWSPPTLLERKARVLARLIGGRRGAALTVATTELAAEIEWAKARLVGPARYETAVRSARRDPPRPPGEVATLYERYEAEKRKLGLLDFDDLIWRCGHALEHDETFAAAQRWRFRHLFVDEFQDVTHAQLRLLRAWLGDRDDVCVVGDPDQAIYGFAGAEPGFLRDFATTFPGGRTVRLEASYRSSTPIVATARSVLPPAARAVPVVARGPDGVVPVVTAYPDARAEATGVARRLREAHGPQRPWRAMAVLYRLNAQSAAFEEALRRAGIPARVRGDAAFLDRPEVRSVLDTLRVVVRAAPGRQLRDHLTDLLAPDPARAIDDADAPAGAGDERHEHAEAVVRLGHEYLAAEGGPGSLDGFLAFLRASLRGDDGGIERDAVELATFHRAKGLEWDTVFVTGLERGLVPVSHAAGDTEAEEEEQRLLYVALSRAARSLHVSWAAQRTTGLRVARRSPSPLLAWIEEAVARHGGAPPPDRAARHQTTRRGVAAARARLAGVDAGEIAERDRPLYDALVAWRRARARAADVPAYVVFDNKTLRLVAGTRPRSTSDLVALPGIGPVKADRYGTELLAVVRDHAAG